MMQVLIINNINHNIKNYIKNHSLKKKILINLLDYYYRIRNFIFGINFKKK